MSEGVENKKGLKPATKGGIFGALILGIGVLSSFYLYHQRIVIESAELENALSFVERNIEQTIAESYAVLLTLSFSVDEEGNVNKFNEVAEQLNRNYSSADILELVPGGVIEYVYPLEGNESVVGYDIANDPNVSEEVKRAAERGAIYFAGPIKLKQGGEAVIGRLPIKRSNELWGFSAVVIYLQTLIERSGIRDFPDDLYYFQLSKINPNTGEEEFFLPEKKEVKLENYYSVNFPEGDWRIYLTKIQNYPTFLILIFYLVTSVVGAFLGGFLVYTIFKKPFDLEVMLSNKSAQLLQSREMFKQKSDLLTSVLESPENMIIFSLDKNYCYLEFNSNHAAICKKVFGKSISVGDNIFEVIGAKHVQKFKGRYRRVLQGESFAIEEEDIIMEKDPPEFWRKEYSPIHNKSGEIIGLTVFSNNITQRVLAERELVRNEFRYRTLISNAPFCVHEINRQGELTSINQAGLDMFGVTNPKEFLGITYPKLVGEKEAEPILELFNRSLEGKPSEFEMTKDGRHYLSSFIPIKNSEDHINRIMGITQDITERRKSEETIENSLNEKITLLSEIHHRVKNNLAIVSGLLELQKYRTEDPKVISAFDESINRIISIAMVHEMMYNSENLSSINIHSYLEKLIPAINNGMIDPEKEILFELDIDDYDLNINEAIPLGLLFNELITNSFKYAFEENKDNKIRIRLKVDGEQVNILYEDNGKGFADKNEFENPKNLGLTLIHTQLEQLAAEYSVVTESLFRLTFSFKLKAKGSHSSYKHNYS